MRFITVAPLLLTICGITAAADKPASLLAEMVKVENEYFALYNQLNTDHQYDMVCQKVRPTGSSFDTRICQPRYVLTAKETAASQRMQSAVAPGSGPANSRGPDVGNAVAGGPAMVQTSKEEAFRQNMLDVLQKSPDLQALGRKRDELQARYDAATKESGGR